MNISGLPLVSGFTSAVEYDGSTHFDAVILDPNVIDSFAFRSQAEINAETAGQGQLPGQPGGNNPQVQFDATMNAAKATISENATSLAIAWQLWPTFPVVNESSGMDEVLFQWEGKWSSDWVDVTSGGMNTHKAFRFDRTGTSDADWRLELQTRFSKTDSSAVALPTIRLYEGVSAGGDGNVDPIRTDEGAHYNWQPGGDTYAAHDLGYSASDHLKGDPTDNAFVIRPDVWVRFTFSITFSGGQQRLRVWMSDEDNAPVLVIADPTDPNIGFLTDWSAAQSGMNLFRFEYNSSQSRTGPPLEAWFRNLIIYEGNGGSSVIAVDDATTIVKNGVNPVTGNVLANDISDDPLTVSEVNGVIGNVGNPVVGSYGTLTVQSDGNYSYLLDNGNVQVAALLTGEMLADTFSYTAFDGTASSTASLDVTIQGSGLGVTSVQALNDTKVLVTFNEPVQAASSQTTTNYSIATGPTVSAAVLQGDNQSVQLTTSTLTQGQNYTLSVSNIVAVSSNTLTNQMVGFLLSPRVTDGLVVLYDLEEGSGSTINDVSGVGTPLDLIIDNLAAVTWVDGGLSVDSSTIISSPAAATKINDAITASGEITIEAWGQPSNNTQSGPARMVSMSTDLTNRNFTLGQDSADYEVRFRTTSTGNNGSSPSLTATGVVQTTSLSHIVYTLDVTGTARLYIDNVLQGTESIGTDLSNWDPTYRLALANELTSDRPWLGELHLVGIYDRALNVAEIDQNFMAGPNPVIAPPASDSGSVLIFGIMCFC